MTNQDEVNKELDEQSMSLVEEYLELKHLNSDLQSMETIGNLLASNKIIWIHLITTTSSTNSVSTPPRR